jgi:hypothetical protein
MERDPSFSLAVMQGHRVAGVDSSCDVIAYHGADGLAYVE